MIMNDAEVENIITSGRKLLSNTNRNKCFEEDKLCALSIKQENQDNTTCLQLKLKCHIRTQNHLIISMLKVFEREVSKFLEQCREEIRVVQEHITLFKKGDSYCRKPFDCSYCLNFKFTRLFGSLSNADTLMKEANEELCLIDIVSPKKWSQFHRSMLVEAVLAIETENIKEANHERKNLQKALEETEDSERHKEIERKLKAFEALDNEMKTITLENRCNGTEYDWSSISCDVFRDRFTPEECCAMWHSYMHPKINKTPWTVKEKKQLKELASKYRFQDWDSISRELGTERSALQCIVQYFNNNQTLFEGRWSKYENRVLENAVKDLAVGSTIPWHIVASYLPGRSKKQVWGHWTYSVNPSIKKGPFTKEEDMLLAAAVRKHGKKFDKVAEVFKDRTSAQLRHRYTLVLEKPKLNVKWEPQDDELLLQLVKKYGKGKWKEIADHFLCFNRIQVRHHYNVLKKRQPASSEEENMTDEPEDWFNENNLIAASSSLVYGTNSDVDKAKRCKLEKMLLPIWRHTREPVISISADFNTDCLSYFRFVQSNPYPRAVKKQWENQQVEGKFHWLSYILYILQARLLIPGYANHLLSHHLLSDTDRQIISLLQDHNSVTEKERTNCLPACKIEPVNEEPVEDFKYISILSEADSVNLNLVKFTMPLNYTTLTGFQYSSSYCEFLKKKIAADLIKHEGSAYSLFEQRLFCLFLWPALASEIEPNFTGTKSDADPKVRKKVYPSRKKKRKYEWLKTKKDADAPQRIKRKYVISGKYKKECSTEVSQIRRSSRIAATSAHSTSLENP